MDHRQKILTLNEALDRRRKLAAEGFRLVFTNGCFDLLHPGHLRYLAEARSLGNFLLVGLNSDRSVRAIKGGPVQGPPRPIWPQGIRAEMLAGLAAVDAVVVFDEDDPLAIVTALEPDVLVKGGDWPVETMIGAKEVLARGGRALSLPLAEGFSTTALVAHIVQRL